MQGDIFGVMFWSGWANSSAASKAFWKDLYLYYADSSNSHYAQVCGHKNVNTPTRQNPFCDDGSTNIYSFYLHFENALLNREWLKRYDRFWQINGYYPFETRLLDGITNHNYDPGVMAVIIDFTGDEVNTGERSHMIIFKWFTGSCALAYVSSEGESKRRLVAGFGLEQLRGPIDEVIEKALRGGGQGIGHGAREVGIEVHIPRLKNPAHQLINHVSAVDRMLCRVNDLRDDKNGVLEEIVLVYDPLTSYFPAEIFAERVNTREADSSSRQLESEGGRIKLLCDAQRLDEGTVKALRRWGKDRKSQVTCELSHSYVIQYKCINQWGDTKRSLREIYDLIEKTAQFLLDYDEECCVVLDGAIVGASGKDPEYIEATDFIRKEVMLAKCVEDSIRLEHRGRLICTSGWTLDQKWELLKISRLTVSLCVGSVLITPMICSEESAILWKPQDTSEILALETFGPPSLTGRITAIDAEIKSLPNAQRLQEIILEHIRQKGTK